MALVVFGPLLLYAYGLALTPGDPEPAASLAAKAWKLEVWRQVERSDWIEVRPMTPWTVFWRLAAGSPLDQSPGERASAWIAKRFVFENATGLVTWKRHVATWAATVWITRHWSGDEVASEIAEMETRRLEARRGVSRRGDRGPGRAAAGYS